MTENDADACSPEAVTWEAADKGASCALGCVAILLFTVALGCGLWFLSGGVWKIVLAAVCALGGIGLVVFIKSPSRGRWEVTIDPGERVIRLVTRVDRQTTVREIAFDNVQSIQLEEIEREASNGEVLTAHLPVIHLVGEAEPVRFDQRLSVRSASRAAEVLEQMRGLLAEPPA